MDIPTSPDKATKKELLELAGSIGVAVPSGATKQVIFDLLAGTEGGTEDGEPEAPDDGSTVGTLELRIVNPAADGETIWSHTWEGARLPDGHDGLIISPLRAPKHLLASRWPTVGDREREARRKLARFDQLPYDFGGLGVSIDTSFDELAALVSEAFDAIVGYLGGGDDE